MGFHLVGDHFYEPIPNTKLIQKRYKDGYRSCSFIELAFSTAERIMLSILDQWGCEFYDASKKYGYREKNYYFRGVDAIALYCLMRDIKPKRIIEIGQGFSTAVIMASLANNNRESNFVAEFISIDPYDRLKLKDKKILGVKFVVIRKDLQNVPLKIFSSLGESDLLFIDSSHVYKFGSDVESLFEEIYPNISKGVYIHIHDIFSPYHYPLTWYVKEKRFWNEQYYLEIFLRFNSTFTVIMPIHLLIRKSILLREKYRALCGYENFKFEGSSFYIKRVG